MAKREVPRTQRVWGDYSKCSGDFIGAGPDQWDSQTPVLVIPEAAVSGCRHANSDKSGPLKVCNDCGSRSWASDSLETQWSRWQRPRILRVGRASK